VGKLIQKAVYETK